MARHPFLSWLFDPCSGPSWWRSLRRLALLDVLCISLGLLLFNCSPSAIQIEAATANAVALAANSALPLLAEAFRQDGLSAIADVKARGGTADEARAAVAAVEAKWAPVWRGWAALRIAEDAWATALEQGGDTAAALAAVRLAYCGLLSEWPSSVPKLVPMVACGR